MMRVRCNWCGWTGFEDDLKLEPDYDTEGEFCGFIEMCPKCNASDAIMDLGDPEQEVDG